MSSSAETEPLDPIDPHEARTTRMDPREDRERDAPDGPACPFCRNAVPEDAVKCGWCGSNIGDIQMCPSCREPVRAGATLCPFCAADLAPPEPEDAALLAEPWVIEASPIGAAITEQLPTALFYPPVLTIDDKEVHVHRRSFLGLRKLDTRLALTRVASVRALQGIFWGGLVIETYGGSSADLAINGLDKEEARETAALLERLVRSSSGRRGKP